MAIVVPAELLTASSGSVGGTVFSRNQHGPYIRDRVFPTDPASPAQLAVRAALTECVNAWRNTLTQSERSSWDTFALAVRTRTALGRSTNAGGLGMFVRANVPRIQAAVGAPPRVDLAPASHTSGSPSPIIRIVLNHLADTLHPFFTASDPWVTEDDAALLFYASPPQPLTRNFWAGPYRFAGKISGHSASPPTSPGTIALPFPAGGNRRVFVRFRLTRADARLSPAGRLPADLVPQVAPLFTDAFFTVVPPTTFTLTVNFDALLVDQFHDPASWLFRFQDRLHNPFLAVTSDNAIVLTTLTGPLNPGPDFVRYAPPVQDVVGLLAGLRVRAFIEGF